MMGGTFAEAIRGFSERVTKNVYLFVAGEVLKRSVNGSEPHPLAPAL